MTKFLAREWAPHNIRVNAILPGFFPAEQNRKILTKERTEAIFNHTPMHRFGETDELSGALLWLASEKASSFVTGAVVPVDGGRSEEHTSELQSRGHLVCRLLLEKKNRSVIH